MREALPNATDTGEGQSKEPIKTKIFRLKTNPHPSPVLNYSGEHNITMTSKPKWLLLVISILFALTGFRPTENSLSLGEGINDTC